MKPDFDKAWDLVLKDDRLATIRKQLSVYELRQLFYVAVEGLCGPPESIELPVATDSDGNAKMKDDLTHSRTCLIWDIEEGCTCCLGERRRIAELEVALGTEQTMHAAWRKRAEEAEAALLTPNVELTGAAPHEMETKP